MRTLESPHSVPTWFPCRLVHQHVEKEENKLHIFVVPRKESRHLGNEYNNLMSPNLENKNHFLLTLNTVLLLRKRKREWLFRQVSRGIRGPWGLQRAQLHASLCIWGWLLRSGRHGRCSTTGRISAAQAAACLLEDPMIKLQTVDVMQAAYDVHFDAIVITLSMG